jgi:predicted RNA-binding Zn-ribbon protein involved in translation (DUF1610 family)
MTEAAEAVRCPKCSRIVPVSADWRLVVCPGCGEVISRMDSDARFD